MGHALWRLFYHVVFATREREPLRSPEGRDDVRRVLWSKAEGLGCVVHAMHVRPDHVHLALSIPPSRAVAEVIGQLKGASSHAVTPLVAPDSGPIWGEGYAVLSFGEQNLPAVVAYVQDQDRRHADGDLLAALETAPDRSPPRRRA